MNQELPDVQVRFRKGTEAREQIANIHWIIEKARKFQKKKNLLLLHWLHKSLWLCASQSTGKILKETWIPVHITCLVRNLYTALQATVRTKHGSTDWFKIGKGVWEDCTLSLCLFNFYAKPIWVNHRLESRFPGVISITSYMYMAPPLWQKAKRN